ncbi:MAG: hypothetical protein Tsb009_08040 [Planctomycetaceae bacterium]
MVSLTLLSGVFSTGCPRPTVAPPRGAIPQRPALGPPGAARVSPLRRAPVPPNFKHPSLDPLGNSWKPKGKPRDWKSIVIHHTATSRGDVESIHQAHLKRKDKNGRHWQGIGYHFVIGNGNGMGDGEIEPTFRWRLQLHGAHAGNNEHNQRGIGIALIGNFEKNRPTRAQLRAVKQLVAVLKREYHIPAKNVLGHSRIRATACPGKLFPLAEVSQSHSDVFIGTHQQVKPFTPLVQRMQETH